MRLVITGYVENTMSSHENKERKPGGPHVVVQVLESGGPAT
jgi:hypothetical protein